MIRPLHLPKAALAASMMIGAVVGAPLASAETLVDATDPARLVTLIRDLGYRAELDTDEVGDPLIRSSVGGTRFSIVFYGCDQDRHDNCKFLLYKVGYDMADGVDLDLVNEWNATQLVGRAYRDQVDDPWLEMSLNMSGGVSVRNVESAFEWWEASVDKFENHIGF